MMRVVFFDKMRETRRAVDNVVQIENVCVRINGRLTSVWHLLKTDGKMEAFKQKDYDILRVEIETEGYLNI